LTFPLVSLAAVTNHVPTLQMISLPSILILAITASLSAANPESDLGDEILRSEIESAAKESRALADDLAAMLARLEAEEKREEAIDAAVLGDNKKVKEALTKMVDKIEELAEASEDSQASKTVKKENIQEEELEKTLEELEIVALQIEKVASSAGTSEDIDAIEEAAVLLQTVSDKVEKKTENIDKSNEKSTKQFNKVIKETSLELNGIDRMIESLEKVTNDLRELNVQTENADIVEIAKQRNSKPARKDPNLPVRKENIDNREGSKGSNKSKEDKVVLSKIQKPREPKQLDLESSNKNEKEDRPEKLEESKIREPKQLEDDEGCSDTEVTSHVRVCEPKVTAVDNTIHLYSGEVKEERHCYDVTKTICEESSQIVSKEACVYSYKQKTVVAPTQMSEVTFERKVEKLEVTKCKKEKVKDGYKEKVVEVCKQEYVEVPFTLPSVAENINELIELSIPEPDENCQTYRYEIPEVNCRDVTTRECSDVAHVEAVGVTEYLDTVQMEYKGNCDQRTLKQQQQVCIKEQKVKPQPPSYRG